VVEGCAVGADPGTADRRNSAAAAPDGPDDVGATDEGTEPEGLAKGAAAGEGPACEGTTPGGTADDGKGDDGKGDGKGDDGKGDDGKGDGSRGGSVTSAPSTIGWTGAEPRAPRRGAITRAARLKTLRVAVS
jgi:hypothetical protein